MNQHHYVKSIGIKCDSESTLHGSTSPKASILTI